ncbi:MAG: hypothetical protein CVV64_10125 [Candidatus Wallbacteria bacterium HGW-Wallbacteria-1]|jgi:3-oxoacyl-[acyl-carrier-protein] synthase II|uniref:Ketosynthase family 3 (KS3) domain-containing protein n=1 Tax=Candidatus Wallbacteria bacterium HGW-Wallbacteria-1 TaxID=2013854 RepID=A0A2N1PPQ3_9BACT|nr:MAG: hypothetical protein CVV64_10125 [Candidatus Wallbacteria bacterium HGW-Wallbacteria-1]
MVKNRDSIVITGAGFITPLGDSPEKIFHRMKSNECAAAPIVSHDCSTMPASMGGAVDDSVIDSYKLDRIKFKLYNRYLKMGVIATANALQDANLSFSSQNSSLSVDSALSGNSAAASDSLTYPEHRRGVFVSTGINGENAEGLFEAFKTSGDRNIDLRQYTCDGIGNVHPQWILASLSNNLIFFLTSEFNLRGDNNNTTYDPAGGFHMLGAAVRSLECGACDIAVVTGTDSVLNWQAQDDLSKIGILQPCDGGPKNHRMAPFTSDARGALPGEAACSLVLEKKSAALNRGARILCEIRSTSSHCTAWNSILPNPDGSDTFFVLNELMRQIPPEAELVINLNGMGCPAWDNAERTGVRKALKSLNNENSDVGRKVLCSTTKAWFCHTYSASFILDTAITAMALATDQLIPPHTAPDHDPDTDTEMLTFIDTFKSGMAEYAICLGQGPGGNTGGVLLEKA